METRKTIKPGQPGTLKYTNLYGDSLICIRYRYDEDQNLCYTTVELIVEKREWFKKKKSASVPLSDEKQILQQTISDQKDTTSSIRIQYDEIELRELVKSNGGIWNRARKAWEIPSEKVELLGLTDRIVELVVD